MQRFKNHSIGRIMNPLIKVENDTLARDVSTGALVETDSIKLKKHRALKRLVKEKDNRIELLNERINKLEQMLTQVLEQTSAKY